MSNNWTMTEVLEAMEKGDLDWALAEITIALAARQRVVDRWKPLNELTEMIRQIDGAMTGTAQDRAELGCVMNQRLKNDFLEHEDPAVKGLAEGVRRDLFIRLLGMEADRVPVP